MEREGLRFLIISMSASEAVADRAMGVMDWLRSNITSVCPIASEAWDGLVDDKLEEDAEATSFALGAMGRCIERSDPDAALYLLLKGEDARELLERQQRECPRRPSGPRPPQRGTPTRAMEIVAAKRQAKGDSFTRPKPPKKQEQKKKQEPKAAAPRPTWIFDGTRIVGSKEPTDEKPQDGDPTELQIGMKFMVLH
jgi:hypothetical protein